MPIGSLVSPVLDRDNVLDHDHNVEAKPFRIYAYSRLILLKDQTYLASCSRVDDQFRIEPKIKISIPMLCNVTRGHI